MTASTFDIGDLGEVAPPAGAGGFGGLGFGPPLEDALPFAAGAHPAPAFGAPGVSFGPPGPLPAFGMPGAPAFGFGAPAFPNPAPAFGAPAPAVADPGPCFRSALPSFGDPAAAFAGPPAPTFGAPFAGPPGFANSAAGFAAPMFGLPGLGLGEAEFQAALLPSQAPIHTAAADAFRGGACVGNAEGRGDSAQPYLLQRAQFDLKQQISKSGFANVYRGVFKPAGWQVALKELNCPTGFPTFIADMAQLFECNDIFLLRIHGITVDPPCCIVTEFVSHGTLAHILKKYRGQMNGTQRTNIAMGIAHAMRALHGHGILHRDLRSANVLLDSGLLPRVADAGLGRLVDAWNEIAPPPARVAAQAQWLAPEQLRSGAASPQSDVYAYAMVLYHLLTGEEPWHRTAPAEFVPRVLAGERPPLPADVFGSGLGDLIAQCWAADPAQRPPFAHIYRLFQHRLVGYSGTKPYGLFQLERLIAAADETQVWNLEAVSQQLADTHVHRRHTSKYVHELHSAAERGDVSDFGKFLTLVPEMNVNAANKDGRAALHIAAGAARDVMAGVICRIEGVDVNVADKKGVTPLMIAAREGLVKIVRTLLAAPGIDVNAADGEGNTALHYAAERGVLDATELILAKGGVDLQKRNGLGKRAADLAVESGNQELVALLTGLGEGSF
jgi:serine/threonine protein kinase